MVSTAQCVCSLTLESLTASSNDPKLAYDRSAGESVTDVSRCLYFFSASKSSTLFTLSAALCFLSVLVKRTKKPRLA